MVLKKLEQQMIVIVNALLMESVWIAASVFGIKRMKMAETANIISQSENTSETFNPHTNRAHLESSSLMNSIVNGAFMMYLQFVVNTKTQNITMAEALS